jgi:phosphatidylserine/phosphatidylglycerophosphate/cardiolipin synthase-like enzyme
MGHVGELLPILVSARNRGVDVRVILDRQVMASPSTGGALEQLRQAIGRESVRTWIGAHSESMHAKFVIADGAVALVTSANLTGHAMVRNVEVGLHTEDQDVVSQLSSFFGRLWVAGDGSESFIQGSDQ